MGAPINPGGPQILSLGKGEMEAEMVDILEENGFNSPYGILGHAENADVMEVLIQNIEGLKALPFAK